MQEDPMVESRMPGAGPDDAVLEAAGQSQREETTLDAFVEEDQGPEENQTPEQGKEEKQT